MPNVYRAYHLDPVTSKIVGPPEVLEVTTDEDALAAARKLVNGKDIELWHGQRLIARLPHLDEDGS